MIVDGADDFSDPAKWVQVSGDVWLAASVTWSPKQVFADGARLTASSAAPASLPARSFQWVSGVGLYVNAAGGNPAGHQARVGRRSHGFVADGRTWVTVDGFTVTRTEDSGIYLSGSYTTVTKNTVTFANGMGIEVAGGVGMVIGSNTVSDNNGHGIALTGGASSGVIENNESFHNAGPAQGSANGIHVDGSASNALRRNRLHDNQGTGLHLQNSSNNCVSSLNRSWNNGGHGYDHVSSTGTLHECDVAFGNNQDGFSIQGNSTGTRIYNSIATDNGLTTNESDLRVEGGSTIGFASDYNLFWNSTSQPPIQYAVTPYASVAAFSAASSQDMHTLQIDPRFADPAAGDFHLRPGSPAIDNANSSALGWPATDAEGHGRVNDAAVANTGTGPIAYSDRGALEFVPGDYAPRVTAAATATGAEGSPLTLSVTASDLDGQALGTLSATRLPAGATFTAGPGNTTGTLNWTPTFTQAGSYTVTFTAANALSGSASTMITVSNTDRAPMITAPATVSALEARPLAITVHVADPDGQAMTSLTRTDDMDGDVITALTADLSSLPPGATFTAGTGNSIGTLTWTPGYHDAGSYTVTFSAANALSGSASTVLTVSNVDRAPAVVAPATASVPEGSPLVLRVHAADLDGDAIGLTANASGLPPGATFTPDPGDTTGALAWTPSYDDAGSYTVAFTAANALSATTSTTITVSNVDRAPTVTVPAAASTPEAGPLTVVVHAADPDGQPLGMLNATGLPAGAKFVAGPGNTAGTLSWTPTLAQAGSYKVTFTAANALSGRASTVLTVSNTDRAPVIAAPATVSVPEASPLTVTVQVMDPDAQPVSSLTQGYRVPGEDPGEAIASLTADVSGLPAGATFTPDPGNTTGTLSWTPTFTQAGSYTVTFTAANALSGSVKTVITVTNVDRSPMITAPATVSVPEAGTLAVKVHVTDPDGQAVNSLTRTDDVDGEAITLLTADLSGLPPGATFTPDPGNKSGTLTWRPGYYAAGSYTVAFTAANALSATTSTAITVTNVDRAPIVTAPATVSAPEAGPISVAVHAADPDGEPLSSLVASGLPAGATFTVGPDNTTGTLTWETTLAQTGIYTVTFTAANALSGSASTVLTVGIIDRPPVVVAPTAITVDEGSGIAFAVHASDPDGEPLDSLTANLSGMPAGIEFLPDPGDSTGKLIWVPSYWDAGEYTVSFTAANALPGTASTHITVRNVDLAPTVSVPASVHLPEASPLSVKVKASDPDGDAIESLTADLSELPAGNNAVFVADAGGKSGTLTWTPGYSDAGTYWVGFRAANALSGESGVEITVSNTDRAPLIAAPATVSAPEASPVSVTVHATDEDGDAITSLIADLSGLPPGATFVAGPRDTTGTVTWTPGYEDAGSYTITFFAANALSAATSTVITVSNLDRAPIVSAPAAVSVPEASPLTVTAYASDPDGEPLSSLTVSGLPPGATFTADPGDTTGTLSWTPGYAHAGSYNVTFTAANALSGSATTVITVSNTDRAPTIAAPATAAVLEAKAVTVTVHAGDIDGEPITSLTADLAGLPPGNNAVFTAGPGDSTGTLTWTPTYADAGNRTVTFTAANALSASASTVITVTNVDRAPIVTAPATVSSPEGSTLVVTVNAADPDGEGVSSLVADLSGLPPGATFAVGPGNTTGTLTWTPGYFQAGSYTVAFFAATGLLSGTAVTSIDITNMDRAPAVNAPAAASVSETSPLTVTVLAADVDGEPITALSANLSGLPAGNNAVFTAGPGATIGTLTWTPTYADSGRYAVTFTAANALSGTATTMIAVSNLDRAPAIVAPAASVAERSPLTLTVHAADVDGDPITSLSASLSGLPAGNDAVFTPGPGDSTGTLSWTPTHDDAGSYTVSFTAANALSATTGAVITVTNVDRAPAVAAPATTLAAEAGTLTVTVHASDIDGDAIASLSADLSGLPAGNNAVFTAGPGDTTGTLTWTPTYADSGRYAVTFTAANALSGSSSTVLQVANTDRAPVVIAPPVVTDPEASLITFKVDATDPDGDPITRMAADLSGLPEGSDAEFHWEDGSTSGMLAWTPTYADSGTYSVTFTAANALAGSASAVITVTNVDRAPAVTAPAAASVAEASPVSVTVHAADADGDGITFFRADLSGLPATNDAVFTVQPGDTTATLTWTPRYEDAGSYTITFFAANALSATTTTTITVTNVDRAPIVSAPATVSVPEVSLLTVTVHAADPDGQPLGSLTADLSHLPAGATFAAGPGDSTGTLSWTPGYAHAGSYSVSFTAANALAGSATTVITVSNTDRAPTIAAPTTAAVLEAKAVSVTVHASDIDGEPITSLSADLAGLPAGNNAVFTPGPGDSTGTLTWTPTYADAGSRTVTFTAANALSASASTVITVTNVDRAPIVTAPPTVSSPEASTLVVTVNAVDPDGQVVTSLAADLSGLPPGATFIVGPGNTTGTLTWTPGYTQAGGYAVAFFAAAGGLSASATTAITITNVDRAPVVSAPAAASVSEASPLTFTVHATDADGQSITTLSADLSSLPAGNNAVFTPGPGDTTGILTWTPTYADSGRYAVTFTATNALSGSAGAVITVSNTDRAPVIAAAAAAVAEQSLLTLTVHAADLDGDALTSLSANLSGLPAGNNAVFTPGPGDSTGTLTWTPSYDDAGSYTVVFTAANALSGSGSTVITVTNADRAPIVSAPATVSGPEASPLSLTVHAADPDGQPLSMLSATGLPPGATFAAGPGDSTGTLSWTPGYAHAGSYNVTFTAANALSGSASTAITVSNTDRAPTIAAPATATVLEARAVTVTVHAIDIDGEPITSLTANLSGLPAGNNAVFTPGPGDSTGTLTWTPSYDDAGSRTVTFTAANALSASASTVITITNVDRAPIVTAPATVSSPEGTTLVLTVQAADPDGQPVSSLLADLTGLPPGATFTVGPGNTTGTVSWTPGYTQAGGYAVTFFVAAGGLSATASTAITITNADRAPAVAAPAAASVSETSPLVVTVHAADADEDAITALSANLSGLPAGNNAVFTPGPGDSTGTLTWTPTYADSGHYAVTFTAANALSGTATTVIAVSNLDRAPAIVAPAASVAERSPLTLTVHAADVDGDPITSLSASLSGLPAGNNAVFTPGPGDSTGTLSWTPTHDDAGSYTVSFTAANALTATTSAVITVTNTDRAPIVSVPATVPAAEAATLTLAVHAADLDGQPVSSLTANLSGLPAGNNALFTPGPGDTTGTFTWTPTYADSGTYTVTFTAANALPGSASTVIRVANTDRAPTVAAPAAAAVAEASPLSVRVHAADVDRDAITSLTANFSGLPAGNNAAFTPDPGDSTGTFTWTPSYDDAGNHTVTFTAANALSGSASTVITVSNVDRAPIVTVPATVSSPEATTLVLTVLAADPDGQPISSLLADLSGLPPGATFTVGPGRTTGTLTWTPGYTHAGGYTVTFFAAAGGLSSSAGTAITITNVDRAPAVAAPAAASVSETSPLTVTVHAADADGDAITALSANLSGLPAGNNAVFTPGPGDSTGTLTWTPTYADSGRYTVAFTAANAISGSATTVITVGNLDRAPAIAAPAAATVAEAGPLSVTVHAADIDGDAISLTANLSGLPGGSNAVFTRGPGDSTGTLTWTPSYDDAGSYSVSFTAANALTATTSTVITVTNMDRAPIVSAPATVSIPETSPLTVTVHAADPDGQPLGSLTADLSHLPAGATFAAGPGDSTGTLSWTPGYGDAGSYSVTFTAANALSGSATTVITVSNTDRAPAIAAPAAASVAEASPVSVTVHATDLDGDAISLTADLSGLPAGNNAAFTPGPGDSTGTLTWTPTYNDAGSYTITFTAANALSASASTVITVTNVDRAPIVAVPATVSAPEASPFVLTVHAADPDGQPLASLTADLSDLPPSATFAAAPGDTVGTLTWNPGYGDESIYTVTFTAANALAGSALTAITITNTDRAPVVSAPAAAAVAETGTVSVTVHAEDIDGEPITSLTAGVSPSPVGSTPVFTPGPGDTTGTLTWTPGYDDAANYTVTFTAANALAGTASTAITVSNVDRAPIVTAPPLVSDPEGGLIAFEVDAVDLDGDPIAWMAADLSGLPEGSDAEFVWEPGSTSAMLAWHPTYDDAGSYTVRFMAFSTADGVASTTITVLDADPGAGPSAAKMPATGIGGGAATPTTDPSLDRAPAVRAPAVPPATASAEETLIDLESGGPFWKVLIGPCAEADGSPTRFERVALGYRGREIAASQITVSGGGPAAVLEARFDRDDLRSLFVGLPRTRQAVTLTVTGKRVEGITQLGTLAADVVGAPAPMRPIVSPNPMRTSALISFATSRPGPLRADIFDASGRRVRRLAGEAAYPAGWHTLAVDGRDDAGSALPAGLYFYRIVSADGHTTGRLALVK